MDRKYQLFMSFPFDYRAVEGHLESMAAKGWMLTRTGILWSYKKIQPAKMRFQVCFTGIAYGMEKAHGWEKVVEKKDFSIYACEGEQKAFPADEQTQVETIHSIMKRTLLRSWISGALLLALLAMRAIWNLTGGAQSEFRAESLLTICILGECLAGFDFLGYLYWLHGSRRRIAQGGKAMRMRFYHSVQNLLFCVCIIGFIVALWP